MNNTPELSIRRRRPLLAIVAAVTAFGMQPALAAFELRPRIEVGDRFDTNPRLTRTESLEQDSNGVVADATLTATYKTERTSVSLAPRYRYAWYSDDTRRDLEDRDAFVSLTGQHQTLRHMFSVSGGYSDVGLRRNEIAATDINNPSDDVNFLSTDQERWTFFPSWQYQLSQTLQLGLSGGYEQVEYDRSPQSVAQQFDYDYATVQASLGYSLSQTSSVALRADASRYDAESSNALTETQSDSAGMSLVYTYSFSETMYGSVRAGYSKTDVETTFCQVPPQFCQFFPPVTVESDSNNMVGEASLTRQGERTTYEVRLSRSLAPNSSGGEVINDRIALDLRHKFTKRLDMRLGVTAYDQSNAVDSTELGATGFQRDQKFGQFLSEFGWQMSRAFSIRANYRFTYIQDDNSTSLQKTDARNHQVFVRLVYRPLPWRR